MSENIAISDLKSIAQKGGYDHIICFATKGQKQFVATYGTTIEQCDQAAQFGDKLKEGLGWPESLHAMPSRVKHLKAHIEKAEKYIKKLEEKIQETNLALAQANLCVEKAENELVALREQTRWVSVSERYPEFAERNYLTLSPFGEVFIMCWNEYWYSPFDENGDESVINVTHWMPLPDGI